MHRTHGALATILALLVALAGCGQAAAPSPTAAPAAAAPTTAPTKAAEPTKATEPTKAPEPTAAPTKPAATPTVAPTAKPTEAAAPTYADVLAKAKASSEYSFDTKTTVNGQSLTTKAAVKGAKFRAETTNAGVKMVTIIDGTTKIATQLMVDQKIAMKIDLAQVQKMVGNAGQEEPLADAKLVGLQTIDGKPAVGFEGKTAAGAVKIWYWIEKGVPLKAEMAASDGATVIEYTNYVFAAQPDSLFTVPGDYKAMDLPIDLGKIPAKP